MKNLRGILSPSEWKRVETAPDYLGDCVVDGKPFKLAAWENISEDGKPYLALVFTSEEDYQKIKEKKRQGVKMTPDTHPNSMESQF